MTERQGDAAASLVTGVGVLDRVIAILDTVERTPMGASELARHLGLSMPTTHRLAGAMVRHGLLRRDTEGRLHPGERFAVSALSGAAEPVLEELRGETGETAQVWVRRGEDRLCLLTLDSRAELRATLPAGTRLPLADGGSAADALDGGEGRTVVPIWRSPTDTRSARGAGHMPDSCSGCPHAALPISPAVSATEWTATGDTPQARRAGRGRPSAPESAGHRWRPHCRRIAVRRC